MAEETVTVSYTPDQKLFSIVLATRDSRFRDRVAAAMVLTAKDVQNENKPDDYVNYTRYTATQEILNQPDMNGQINKIVWFVASHEGISATFYVEKIQGVDGQPDYYRLHDASSDNDIRWVVSLAFDALYEAPPRQTPPDVH